MAKIKENEMKFLNLIWIFCLAGSPAFGGECPDINGTFIYTNPKNNGNQPNSLEDSDIRIRIESKVEGDFRSYAVGTNKEGPISTPAMIADSLPHEVSRGFGKEIDTYTCLSASELEMRIDLKDNPYDSETNKITMRDSNTLIWQMITKHNAPRSLLFIRAY